MKKNNSFEFDLIEADFEPFDGETREILDGIEESLRKDTEAVDRYLKSLVCGFEL